MKNKADVKSTFYVMAKNLYGETYARGMLEDYDKIMGEDREIFEVEGWRDAKYVLFHREDDKWDWVFEDPIEGDEYGGIFDTRREAMHNMARDADATLLWDKGMGLRIREAI